MAELCFLLAPRQNHFFVEIVEALRDELDQLGVRSSLSVDGFPAPRPGLAYVLVPPHEYVALAPKRHLPEPRHLERTIFFCTEQPGTWFFDEDVRLAKENVGAVVDVNEVSVGEFRRLGVDSLYAPLGWTRSWSHVDFSEDGPDDQPEREIDVLHLGIHSDRRAVALAAAGNSLWRWNSKLILSDSHKSNDRAQANFAIENEKWSLLSNSRVLLNVHVSERQYFEWQRIVQAICNGACVVSEHSYGTGGLKPGEHFLSGRLAALGLLAHDVLEDEAARWTMARDAYRYLRDEQPLAATATLLAELADDIVRKPVSRANGRNGANGIRGKPEPEATFIDDQPPEFPSEVTDRQSSALRSALKDVRLDLLNIKREMRRLHLERATGGEVPVVERVAESIAYRPGRPVLSVITALYNYEKHIAEALESCALSELREIELVVVDDGSSDRSAAVVQEWIAEHPDVPAMLLRHPVNRGLGAARNTAICVARGAYTFILDADNSVYPTCFPRLVEALEEEPEASAAHCMLEMFFGERPWGLRSVFPWQPDRFRTGNYIDAMAMWRTATLRRLGGFTTDTRLHGWEDYDLWVRLAENEGSVALVPEVLARYRVTNHSMLALTDISTRAAVSIIAERYPKTMHKIQVPL